MPNYDVLIYRDFSSDPKTYRLGDPAYELGDNLHVVALGPAIHDGKDATMVLAFGNRPMEELEALIARPDGS